MCIGGEEVRPSLLAAPTSRALPNPPKPNPNPEGPSGASSSTVATGGRRRRRRQNFLSVWAAAAAAEKRARRWSPAQNKSGIVTRQKPRFSLFPPILLHRPSWTFHRRPRPSLLLPSPPFGGGSRAHRPMDGSRVGGACSLPFWGGGGRRGRATQKDGKMGKGEEERSRKGACQGGRKEGGSEEWGRVPKKLTAMHARIIWNFKVLLGVQVLFGYSL